MIDFPSSAVSGDLFDNGTLTWRYDGTKWIAATSVSLYNQGEVLGNPLAGVGSPTPAGLGLMLRAALGDGVVGQVIASGGTGVNPAWATIALKYVVGCFVPGLMTASQILLVHRFSKAVTLPANFGAYGGYASQASGTANATASTVVTASRALAASPTTFSNVGTVTFAAGGTVPTFVTTSGAVAFAQGDLLRLSGPATADTTFAGFACTIVTQEV
jgi:hypothetical protein